MKKLFFPLAILAIVSILSSCSPKPEEMLRGTWVLEDVEIVDIDNLSKVVYDQQIKEFEQQLPAIEGQIAQIEEQIATSKEDKEKETLQSQLEVFNSDLVKFKEYMSALTVESVKEEMKGGINEFKGELKYSFGENSAFKNLLDESEGTWSITEDGKTLTITMEDRDTPHAVSELSEEKLTIVFEENQGEMKIKINMMFKKSA